LTYIDCPDHHGGSLVTNGHILNRVRPAQQPLPKILVGRQVDKNARRAPDANHDSGQEVQQLHRPATDTQQRQHGQHEIGQRDQKHVNYCQHHQRDTQPNLVPHLGKGQAAPVGVVGVVATATSQRHLSHLDRFFVVNVADGHGNQG